MVHGSTETPCYSAAGVLRRLPLYAAIRLPVSTATMAFAWFFGRTSAVEATRDRVTQRQCGMVEPDPTAQREQFGKPRRQRQAWSDPALVAFRRFAACRGKFRCLWMVRRMTVHPVHAGRIDEPVRKGALRLRDVVAPVSAPVDGSHHDIAGALGRAHLPGNGVPPSVGRDLSANSHPRDLASQPGHGARRRSPCRRRRRARGS